MNEDKEIKTSLGKLSLAKDEIVHFYCTPDKDGKIINNLQKENTTYYCDNNNFAKAFDASTETNENPT